MEQVRQEEAQELVEGAAEELEEREEAARVEAGEAVLQQVLEEIVFAQTVVPEALINLGCHVMSRNALNAEPL